MVTHLSRVVSLGASHSANFSTGMVQPALVVCLDGISLLHGLLGISNLFFGVTTEVISGGDLSPFGIGIGIPFTIRIRIRVIRFRLSTSLLFFLLC